MHRCRLPSLLAATVAGVLANIAIAADLPSVAPMPRSAVSSAGFDGVVEAVRQSVIAAQVSGAVVRLDVKAGDRVAAGQVLLRIDARAAEQSAAASDAQLASARAALEAATGELERQRQLLQKQYISRAAFERAESEFKVTQAQVNAQLAQAGSAHTQSGFHVVRAPFAGIVSEVPVALGDMAMPGRALLTLFDPQALRVAAAVPQGVAARWSPDAALRIEIPGAPGDQSRFAAVSVRLLPAVDPVTNTQVVRADLAPSLKGVAPGMFARVWLPVDAARGDAAVGALSVPLKAVVRRAEMTGLYVLDQAARPVLRQVRLGRVDGDRIEVLSGVAPGERVVTDPQAAARTR